MTSNLLLLSNLLPFLIAALALNLTPGADMTYIITRSVAQGRRAGVVSAFGIATGSLVHTAAAAAGISVILVASPIAFWMVKMAGAAYLIYLAISLLRDGRPSETRRMERSAALARVYRQAVVVNLLNPKVALFIVAFLPQFADPARGSVALQIILLGILFNVTGTAVNVAVAWFASATAGLIKGSNRFRRALNWIAASILATLAVRIAFAERN